MTFIEVTITKLNRGLFSKSPNKIRSLDKLYLSYPIYLNQSVNGYSEAERPLGIIREEKRISSQFNMT